MERQRNPGTGSHFPELVDEPGKLDDGEATIASAIDLNAVAVRRGFPANQASALRPWVLSEKRYRTSTHIAGAPKGSTSGSRSRALGARWLRRLFCRIVGSSLRLGASESRPGYRSHRLVPRPQAL
jgi:hypothetical protein